MPFLYRSTNRAHQAVPSIKPGWPLDPGRDFILPEEGQLFKGILQSIRLGLVVDSVE